ncbi:hypothetical protein ACHAXT_004007 [Thalassiosira profunda]
MGSLGFGCNGRAPSHLLRMHQRLRAAASPAAPLYVPGAPIASHQQWRGSQSSNQWRQRQEKDPYVQRAKELGWPSRAAFKLQEINEDHFPALMAKAAKKQQKKGKGRNPSGKLPKRLLRPGTSVLDLGAAPGGWSLYASTQLQPVRGGAVVAVDLLPLDETLQSNHSDIALRIDANLQGRFRFVQGDFANSVTREQIMDAFAELANEKGEGSSHRPELILSDMAPNFMGDNQTDALRTLNLCEQALAFAAGHNCFDSSYSARNDDDGMLAPGGSFLCKYFFCGKENEADLMDAAKRAFRSVHTIKPKASRKESSEVYLLAFHYI